MEVYETLCNEPWCWSPREVDELTDFQIWELVIKPAVEKSKEREKRNPNRGRVGVPDKKTRLPTREEYVLIGQKFHGDPEVMGKEYDKWAESEQGKRLSKRKR